MLRRTGFAKKTYVPAAAAPLRALVRAGLVTRVSGDVIALPKPAARRNPHLIAMARNQLCVLRVPGVCNGDRTTVVAAHSNLSIHAKGGARKADDQYHVHACSACHRWLDQGSAPAEVKTCAFMAAHLWMVDIWRGIVAGFIDATPKDRAAAQWALDQLSATPVHKEPECDL